MPPRQFCNKLLQNYADLRFARFCDRLSQNLPPPLSNLATTCRQIASSELARQKRFIPHTISTIFSRWEIAACFFTAPVDYPPCFFKFLQPFFYSSVWNLKEN